MTSKGLNQSIDWKKVKGSLMVQGTTSDAGKSTLVAGLCRLLKRNGVSVAPFKPQNMALNSAVTPCGGEIGRAQALQADACGLDYRTDFNPVLLKPSSDKQSQVIVQGRAISTLDAKHFGGIKALAFSNVLESYARLKAEFDVVLIEGAGSPAEINLRERDIANMGFAVEVNCPVLLVSDIDRGGVFAHIVGTLALLSEHERQLVKLTVINKFRGDLGLLQSGVDWLERETGKPMNGVLPFINDLSLDAEDAIAKPVSSSQNKGRYDIFIKVIVLPRISNHTDFEPLACYPNVKLEYIRESHDVSGADLLIIPGSKNVRDDLDYLKQNGFESAINQHLRYGGKLLGICGGFQMLGSSISDPKGFEGNKGTSEGLSFFNFKTELKQDKFLKQVRGQFDFVGRSGIFQGYEIHCGLTQGDALNNPFCKLTDQNGLEYSDGVISDDNQIVGTYVHGLFESQSVVETIFYWVKGKNMKAIEWSLHRERELERLADHLESHLDIKALVENIG